MSNKIKFFVGALAVAAMAFGLTVKADAAFAYTGLLKQGMTSSSVMSLQQTLNMTSCKVSVSGAGSPGMESMYFGSKTKAAVQCFQAANGLTADGVVGAMTGAALAAVTGTTPVVPGLPAGCTSTAGFSTTTGQSCASAPTLPAGCTSTVGFSPTTGQSCSGGSTPSTGTLSGGAGDLNLSSTSTDVEDSVAEGEDDVKVLGMKAEADGSDVAITSIKVEFKNNGYATSSENFAKYVDEVSVWLGDTKVGSADVDEFTKDSDTPDTFSKTISLSGATIREDDEEKLYIAVSAVSTIDSEDYDHAAWDIEVDTVRFNDATGAILSADVSDFDYTDNDAFTFEDATANDDLELKSSSSNPDDATILVDEDDSTDDTLALAAKLSNDDDSSDADILNIPVDITLDNYGTDASSADDVIDTVTLTIDGKKFEGDLSGSGALNGDGTSAVTVTYNFDIEDVTIDSGDDADVTVLISFNGQEDNYAQNTVVTASIDNDDIDAENADGDEIDVSGSERTGADLTLNTSVASVSNVKWTALEGGAGVQLQFTVEADDDSVDVTLADLQAADTVTTSGTVGAPTLTKVSGDATNNGGDSYTVADGDDATFTLVYTNTGANGTSVRVTMPTIAGQDVSDDDQISPLVIRNLNS